MKIHICAHRTDTPIRVNGIDDLTRLSVQTKCTAGPVAILDRYMTLLLTTDEARKLADELISKLNGLQEHGYIREQL